MGRPEQPVFLTTPEREPDAVAQLGVLPGQLQGKLEDDRDAGPVVVDARSIRDTVEVGANHHDAVVTTGQLREEILGDDRTGGIHDERHLAGLGSEFGTQIVGRRQHRHGGDIGQIADEDTTPLGGVTLVHNDDGAGPRLRCQVDLQVETT